jgi:hypothetical protein
MGADGDGNRGRGAARAAVDINKISRKIAVDQHMLEVALDMLGRDSSGLLERSTSGTASWLRDAPGEA